MSSAKKQKLIDELTLGMAATSGAMEDVASAAWRAAVSMRKHDVALLDMFQHVTKETGDAVVKSNHIVAERMAIFESKLETYARIAAVCQKKLDLMLDEIAASRAAIRAEIKRMKP